MTTRIVSLNCIDAPDTMCGAFAELIETRYPGTSVALTSQPAEAALDLELVVDHQSKHRLAGRLRWSDATGHTQGPPLDFNTQDTAIGPHVYKKFLLGLLIGSNPPI